LGLCNPGANGIWTPAGYEIAITSNDSDNIPCTTFQPWLTDPNFQCYYFDSCGSGPTSGGGGSTPIISAPPKAPQQPCVPPNKLQRAGIAAQGLLARLTGKTIGIGAGVSVAGGNVFGLALSFSRQVVVSPSGQAAFATTYTAAPAGSINGGPFTPNSLVYPPGVGGYGGYQFSVSNASTPQDLGDLFVNGGAGGGRGCGGGIDVAAGVGTQGQFVYQATGTIPFGGGAPSGGIGFGGGFTYTELTPICKE
jgi:hypothetical protein